MSGPTGDPLPGGEPEPEGWPPEERLIYATYRRTIEGVRRALASGADINHVDPETGLAALHIAVGNNDIAMCRFLIEDCRARFFPDGFGRWPTLVAAECQVDEALSDYIVGQEAKFAGPHAR